MISNIITFTSDFGLQGEWVAAVKGVMLAINSHAEIYDISHQIPSFNIRKGSTILQSAIPYFPMGTHLAVVDPGVGGNRRIVALRTERGDILVGPDNGLLIDTTKRLGGIEQAIEIRNEKFFLKPVCPTFQARDIMAPVTAHLSKGEGMIVFGKEITKSSLVQLEKPKIKILKDRIEAEVVDIDSFGTVRFFIKKEDLKKSGLSEKKKLSLIINKKEIKLPITNTFEDVKPGKPLLLFDSSDFLSISINQGNAAIKYNINTGEIIHIK